jgi:hypothetical protein
MLATSAAPAATRAPACSLAARTARRRRGHVCASSTEPRDMSVAAQGAAAPADAEPSRSHQPDLDTLVLNQRILAQRLSIDEPAGGAHAPSSSAPVHGVRLGGSEAGPLGGGHVAGHVAAGAASISHHVDAPAAAAAAAASSHHTAAGGGGQQQQQHQAMASSSSTEGTGTAAVGSSLHHSNGAASSSGDSGLHAVVADNFSAHGASSTSGSTPPPEASAAPPADEPAATDKPNALGIPPSIVTLSIVSDPTTKP